ncbi:hypothetical protein GCM10008012_59770 [Rhizobium anhuiense]|nr:hypothetical protein GCM10008012_59770 [Rhizobium anhuiense]
MRHVYKPYQRAIWIDIYNLRVDIVYGNVVFELNSSENPEDIVSGVLFVGLKLFEGMPLLAHQTAQLNFTLLSDQSVEVSPHPSNAWKGNRGRAYWDVLRGYRRHLSPIVEPRIDIHQIALGMVWGRTAIHKYSQR